MRFAFPARAALALLALTAAACADDRAPTTTPPPDPGTKPPPKVVGVYEITITGIGSDQMTSSIRAVQPGAPGGTAAVINPTPVTTGLLLEAVQSGSFSEGSRTGGGHRYLTATFRVRNNTAGALSNITYLMVGTTGTIAGTPVSQLRKFDGTTATASIAQQIVPTGATGLAGDLVSMTSPYADVLQVFTEAEVSGITLPAGVTNVFPYGFMVRNKNTNANRTLPSASADANQYDGLLTVAFRVPLQSVATDDVFTLVFQALAVTDSETRLTESVEESQDTGAVRRLRDRATSLGATTVTVLNGSPAMDAAVPDYPGQRQICSFRTAGTSGAPTNTNVSPAAYSKVLILTPGETVDGAKCAPYFRSGTASRPATNVPFTVTVKAMDRYGNVKTAQADTFKLVETNGVPAGVGPSVGLVSGSADLSVTYTDYGSSLLMAQGKRLAGVQPIPVAGVVRTWTAGGGTSNWSQNTNWSPLAVPMSLDSVYIPTSPAGGPIFPVLTANVQVAGVEVQDAAAISLTAFDLSASGNVKTGTNGGIVNTSGRLFLTGIARTVEGKVPTLRVTGTYSATTGSNSNITARAPIQVDAGRLTVSGLRLQADAN